LSIFAVELVCKHFGLYNPNMGVKMGINWGIQHADIQGVLQLLVLYGYF
jgi:hypothetical protein